MQNADVYQNARYSVRRTIASRVLRDFFVPRAKEVAHFESRVYVCGCAWSMNNSGMREFVCILRMQASHMLQTRRERSVHGIRDCESYAGRNKMHEVNKENERGMHDISASVRDIIPSFFFSAKVTGCSEKVHILVLIIYQRTRESKNFIYYKRNK